MLIALLSVFWLTLCKMVKIDNQKWEHVENNYRIKFFFLFNCYFLYITLYLIHSINNFSSTFNKLGSLFWQLSFARCLNIHVSASSFTKSIRILKLCFQFILNTVILEYHYVGAVSSYHFPYKWMAFIWTLL